MRKQSQPYDKLKRVPLKLNRSSAVMRGQKRAEDARERAGDPRIHLLAKRMDCRVKPGNDDRFNMTGSRYRERARSILSLLKICACSERRHAFMQSLCIERNTAIRLFAWRMGIGQIRCSKAYRQGVPPRRAQLRQAGTGQRTRAR